MFDIISAQPLESSSPLVQVPMTQQELPAQKYLQSPFSVAWSRLETLFQTNQALRQPQVYGTEQERRELDTELDLYSDVADRVDPALYYAIFFSPGCY